MSCKVVQPGQRYEMGDPKYVVNSGKYKGIIVQSVRWVKYTCFYVAAQLL